MLWIPVTSPWILITIRRFNRIAIFITHAVITTAPATGSPKSSPAKDHADRHHEQETEWPAPGESDGANHHFRRITGFACRSRNQDRE